MAITLSYEMHKRLKSDVAAIARVQANTEFLFKLCADLGLQEEQNIRARVQQIQHNTDRLMQLLSSPQEVDIHARDSLTGQTVLHVLAGTFFPPVCVLNALLQAGADPNARTADSGETPLLVALKRMQHRLHMLGRKIPALDAYYTTQMGHYGGAPKLQRNAYTRSQSQKRLLSFAEQLLCYGADLYVRDNQRQHALDGAISLADWPEIGALVQDFESEGLRAAQAAGAGKTPQMLVSDLLKCANIGRLEEVVSSENWSHDLATTLEAIENLPPALQQILAPQLSSMICRESPRPVVYAQAVPHEADRPAVLTPKDKINQR